MLPVAVNHSVARVPLALWLCRLTVVWISGSRLTWCVAVARPVPKSLELITCEPLTLIVALVSR